jgi:hypothetical protein
MFLLWVVEWYFQHKLATFDVKNKVRKVQKCKKMKEVHLDRKFMLGKA